jgi:ABC-type multidrug transport system ATPase subunit
MDVLVFQEVSKAFRGRPVLRHVSFAIGKGELVGLIGDNGAGKTTLLRLAARILVPSGGSIALFGEPDPVPARARLGALLERPGHYDEVTVRDNLHFFYSFYTASASQADAAVAQTLEEFELGAVADQLVGRLSTGYRQRVAIARALHPWAELALLDEPFESLDPVARHHVKQVIRARRERGLSLVISSHTLTDLAHLCERLLLLADTHVRQFDGFAHIAREVGHAGLEDLDALYARLREQAAAAQTRVH